MRLSWIAWLSLSILFTTCCLGDDSPRALYDQGKYQEALEALQRGGVRTAADYFNAANCYWRIGKVGQSISYYEKALTLAPQSEDVRYNLHLALNAAEKTGSLIKDQTLWTGTIVPHARHVPEYICDILFALCTGAIGLVAFRAKKRGLRPLRAMLQPGFASLLVVWLGMTAFTVAVVLAHQTRLAAIVADFAIGRSGPAETFTELFKVPAGSKVELTGEARDGWRQVRFSLGNVGWIMDKDLLTL